MSVKAYNKSFIDYQERNIHYSTNFIICGRTSQSGVRLEVRSHGRCFTQKMRRPNYFGNWCPNCSGMTVRTKSERVSELSGISK